MRLKGFQGEWEKVLIGKLGTTYSGLSGKTKEDFGFGDARFVTFLNVLTNAIINTSILEAVCVCEGEHQNEVRRGDLLFNTSSETPEEVGMCAVIDEEQKNVYLNSFCFGFRVTDKNIDPTFIAYLMRSHIGRRIMSILAQGATRYNLSKNSFCKAELLLPKTKAEQQLISKYFTSIDSLIQSTTKKIESLKQVKAASLQSMFPQNGETTPRVRFKGFEGEWKKVLVGKLGTTYSGLSGKSKDDFGISDTRYVTFLNVLTNAIIDTSILETVNICEGEHQNEVKKGDLLFNTSSETPEEVGMCAVMDEELTNVFLNSFCFGFRVTDNNIDSTFIAYLMRSHIGRGLMSILAQGATRYNLSKNSFCKAELLLPKAKKEQSAIAEYFTSLDTQITLQTQHLEKLKQIKSACLDNMFV